MQTKQLTREAQWALGLTVLYMFGWIILAYFFPVKLGILGLPIWFELSCVFSTASVYPVGIHRGEKGVSKYRLRRQRGGISDEYGNGYPTDCLSFVCIWRGILCLPTTQGRQFLI